MFTSGGMPAKSTGSRVHRQVAGDTPARGEVAVWQTERHSSFEIFLAEFSADFAVVAPDDMENTIGRWLDQLAHQLGAERCTVAEFSALDKQPGFHMQWLVGKQPLPFIGPEDSWIRDELAGGQLISISTLADLPAEAFSTRQQLEEMGICSGLWVPIMAEGSAIGGIGLCVKSHEQHWPALVVRRCQIVGDIFGNAFLRRRKARDIEERLKFEALIANFSNRLIDGVEDIDAITDEILSELGLFLGADRAGYLEVDSGLQELVPTRLWSDKSVDQDESVQDVDVSAQFPWLTAKILKNEAVTIDEMAEFPDEAANERQYCESMGIQSFVMVPAVLRGTVTVAAAVSLDSIHEPRIWDASTVQRLQIVARMIASAQDRSRRRCEIEVLQRFERALSDISTAFVNLAPEMVDGQIETGLATAGQALNADLVTLLQPLDDDDFEVTHEWASERWDREAFKGVHVAQHFPWLAEQLLQNEALPISALSDLRAEATEDRVSMEQAGLESVIFVPFNVRGELAGYVAINNVQPTTWSESLVQQLRLLGEVFGGALSRRDAELKLQSSLDKIKSLQGQLQQENLYLRDEARLTHIHGEIIGDSASLRAALTKVEQVATTDSTVLILGETGTGKELLARAIHNLSSRKDKVMVKVNCAALPSSLVEAELFGREKGAYTGALTRELGRFEIADGSTILLDEIAELSLELQAKLLRVLQDGEFERLGSSKTRKTDVRVLAATNRNLAEAVENKKFREDLFYRLNVFPITVPPLRDRVEDIPQLVWAFVQEFSAAMGKTIESIPVAVMDSLKAYAWPGNVREVRNIIERAMIISTRPTLKIDLEDNTSKVANSKRLADVERDHIQAVVQATGWRIRGVGGAAEILGLKATTLEARMKKLGIQRTSTR